MSWWLRCQSGLSEPSAWSKFSRGGLGGGEHAMKMFCSLWELCRNKLWPIVRKERSPKLSVWAPLLIWERCRKSASGRLIMLTERISLRLESPLGQPLEDGFLYNDVLRGIVRVWMSQRFRRFLSWFCCAALPPLVDINASECRECHIGICNKAKHNCSIYKYKVIYNFINLLLLVI